MRIILLLLAFTFILPLNAGQMIWEVKSKTATVYILGSIHLAKDSLYPLNSEIEQAYEKSDFLVVELDPSNVDPAKMFAEMMLPPGETLESKLDKETYAKLKKELAKANVQPMEYQRLKPWAATFIILQNKLSKSGYDAGQGIDNYFLTKAKKDSKDILELESADFQLSMFNEFDKAPADYLDYSLDNIDETTKSVDEMFAAWAVGDTAALSNIMYNDQEKYPEYERIYEMLLDKRNVSMVEKIKKYLITSKTYFVVVGAGHLVGEEGIIKILDQNSKYTLKQFD